MFNKIILVERKLVIIYNHNLISVWLMQLEVKKVASQTISRLFMRELALAKTSRTRIQIVFLLSKVSYVTCVAKVLKTSGLN